MIEGKKLCNLCGGYKTLDCFSVNTRSKDNRANTCKDCVNKRHRKRLEARQKEKDFWKEFSII